MNQTLKEELDKLTTRLATKHACSEKFINICIQVQLVVAKIGIIKTFSKSNAIDLEESVRIINGDVSNIIIIAASLTGIEDTAKVMAIYSEVNAAVNPLVTATYTPMPSTARN